MVVVVVSDIVRNSLFSTRTVSTGAHSEQDRQAACQQHLSRDDRRDPKGRLELATPLLLAHADSTRLHPGGLNHRKVPVQSPALGSGLDSVHGASRCARIPEYRVHLANSLSACLTSGGRKEASRHASV